MIITANNTHLCASRTLAKAINELREQAVIEKYKIKDSAFLEWSQNLEYRHNFWNQELEMLKIEEVLDIANEMNNLTKLSILEQSATQMINGLDQTQRMKLLTFL